MLASSSRGAAMRTIIIFQEVDDVEQWLASPKRHEVFGPLGITARTFVDPDAVESRRADRRGAEHGGLRGGDRGTGRGRGLAGRRRAARHAAWCSPSGELRERVDLLRPTPKAVRPGTTSAASSSHASPVGVERAPLAEPVLREREQRRRPVVLPSERGRDVERGEQVLLGSRRAVRAATRACPRRRRPDPGSSRR